VNGNFLLLLYKYKAYETLRFQMPEEQLVLEAVRALGKAHHAYPSSKVHVNKGSSKKVRHIHLTIVSERSENKTEINKERSMNIGRVEIFEKGQKTTRQQFHLVTVHSFPPNFLLYSNHIWIDTSGNPISLASIAH
jgi:hypothetical protein